MNCFLILVSRCLSRGDICRMDEVEGAGWVAEAAAGWMTLISPMLAWLGFGTLGDDEPLFFAVNTPTGIACSSSNTTSAT